MTDKTDALVALDIAIAHAAQSRVSLHLTRAKQLREALAAQPAASVDVDGLHPHTADLVQRFATALAEKLAAAERKYGWSDHWKSPSWMDQCREQLVEHVAKGDPRDVAAYCAFLWHHGERTALIDSAGWARGDVARFDHPANAKPVQPYDDQINDALKGANTGS